MSDLNGNNSDGYTPPTPQSFYDRAMLTCENCFFMETAEVIMSKKSGPGGKILVRWCHRYPPKGDSGKSNMPYPQVDPEKDWCGEWSPTAACKERMFETQKQENLDIEYTPVVGGLDVTDILKSDDGKGVIISG